MYSMTLFIVLLSDHEFLGSGSRPSVPEERMRHSFLVTHPPAGEGCVLHNALLLRIGLDGRLVRAAADEDNVKIQSSVTFA